MPERLLPRFSRTERALHWVHASAFLVMLGTGLVLSLAPLSEAVGRRPLLKEIHLDTAIAWGCALALVVLLGDRASLRRTAREIDLFDRDDRLWLRGRHRPVGRFNPGQKLNAVLTAAFAVLFAVSGILLWAGERDHRFQLAGAGALHDALTWASLGLFAGHLYLAVVHPRTRHALRGITTGTVREEWAREHHPKWAAQLVSEDAPAERGAAVGGELGAPRAAAGAQEARDDSPPALLE